MAERSKISVIVSTYNSERFFRGKMVDLLRQTSLDRLEIIVVVSGSEQNEAAILSEYAAKYPQIKSIITEERESLYRAWNRGIRAASGKYITNANTDDRLRSDAFAVLAAALDNNPFAALVYADQYITNLADVPFEKAGTKRRFKRQDFSFPRLLAGYLAGSQSMWRTDIHKKDDIWFDESFEVAGDYDFICRIAEKYDLKRVNEVLGSYYLSDADENLEHRDKPLAEKESYEVRLKYAKRFIERLPEKKRAELRKRISRIAGIGKPFFSLARKTMDVLMPSRQLPPRVFYIWLGAVLEEMEGNTDRAAVYCSQYAGDDSIYMIQRQLEHLQKSGGQV